MIKMERRRVTTTSTSLDTTQVQGGRRTSSLRPSSSACRICGGFLVLLVCSTVLVQESRGCSPGRTSQRSRNKRGFQLRRHLLDAESGKSNITEAEGEDLDEDVVDDDDEPDESDDEDPEDDVVCEDLDEVGCYPLDSAADDIDDGYVDNLDAEVDFDFSNLETDFDFSNLDPEMNSYFGNHDTATDSAFSAEQQSLSIKVVVTDVLIVGLGAAGMNTAYNLEQEGTRKDWIIVEASGRIGGRVSKGQIEIKGGAKRTIEKGANWVSGADVTDPANPTLPGNPLADIVLAPDVKLRGTVQDFGYRFFNKDGKRNVTEEDFESCTASARMDKVFNVGARLSTRCLRDFKKGRRKYCKRLSPEANVPFNPMEIPDLSVEDLYQRAFDFSKTCGPDVARWEPYLDESGLEVAIQSFYIDFEFGERTTVLSGAKYQPESTYDDWGDTDRLTVDRRGFVIGLKKLASEFLDGKKSMSKDGARINNFRIEDERVMFRTKIVKVFSVPNGVWTLVCKTRMKVIDGKTIFKCGRKIKDFFFIKATNLVTTWSVGVWKKSLELDEEKSPLWSSIDVAPRFYPPLTQTTEAVKGALDKVGMGVYTRVAMSFKKKFWTNQEYFVSAAGNGAFNGDFVPVFQNLDRKGLYKGSKIISGFMFGPRGRDVNSQSDEDTLEQVLGVLSDMFESNIDAKYGRPRLERDDLQDYIITDWTTDPLFYGAYSYLKPFVTDEQTAALSGPLAYGRHNIFSGSESSNILISGEHSCERLTGYYHGGLEAGKRSAKILNGEIDPVTLCDYSPQEIADKVAAGGRI